MRMFPGCALVLLAVVVLAVAACDPKLPDQPVPDAATCSDPSNGDRAGFEATAAPILTTYCTWCHAASKTTLADRKGAPLNEDYDDYDFVLGNTYLTWARVADRTMPPLGRLPSEAEYQALLSWLSCADAYRDAGLGDDDDSTS